MHTEDDEAGRHRQKDQQIDDVLAFELNGLAVNDTLQFACGDQRSGGSERAKYDFKSKRAARDSGHVSGVNEKLSDADEGRGQCTEGVRERSSLRHGGHRNRDRHPGADDGADGEPGDDPDPGDDVGADERADDGREHAGLGKEHAAARGLRVRHALEREDEEDGSDEVSSFHEVGGEGHFVLPRLFGLALVEHLQHAIGDAEAANHVDGGGGDRDESQDVREQRIVRRTRQNQRADERDAGDGIGGGHQRRVQQRRHAADDLVAQKGSQGEDVNRSDQDGWIHSSLSGVASSQLSA